MSIYINRNNQQTGPFEESDVLAQLGSGSLSPNDMGIRRGDTSWQRLGDMFPGVDTSSGAPPMGSSASAFAGEGSASVASTPVKKGGGCLKGGLIGAGILLLLLGIATAVGSRFIPSTSCDLAESDARTIEKLRSDIEKAKSAGDFDKIGPLSLRLQSELAGAEVSEKYCNDDKARDNLIGIAGGVIGALGLLMAVVGLFVGRRKG